MIFSIKTISFVIIVCTLSLNSVTSVERYEVSKSSSISHDKQTIPLDRIFTPDELNIVKSGKGISLTPLLFEQKLQLAWVAGNEDMKQVIKKSNIDANQLEKMNSNTPIVEQAAQLASQLLEVYALGGLHFWNEMAKQSGVSIPPMKVASDAQMIAITKIFEKLNEYMQQPEQVQMSKDPWQWVGKQLIKEWQLVNGEGDESKVSEMSESKESSELESESGSQTTQSIDFDTNVLGFGQELGGFGGFGYQGFGFGEYPGFGFGGYPGFGWGNPGLGFGGFGFGGPWGRGRGFWGRGRGFWGRGRFGRFGGWRRR